MTLETFVLFLNAMAFIWGAVWGSFLNVVIYRLPAGLNLATPPSRCPKCMTQLAWYDNVPIFGWLWLRGKCRYCKVPIPIRYPAIELLTGLLGLALWVHITHGRFVGDPTEIPLLAFGMTFSLYFFFIAILVSITFIDLDETIIPHELTGLGTVLGLVAVFVIPRHGPMMDFWPMMEWYDAIIGMVAGGGLIWAIIKGYALIRGIEGMGWGDFTMLGMCGVWTGWRGVIFILFAASVQGLVATLLYAGWLKLRGKEVGDDGFLIKDVNAIDADPEDKAKEKKECCGDKDCAGNHENASPEDEEEHDDFGQLAAPFGPFLALAAIEYILIGEWLLPLVLGR